MLSIITPVYNRAYILDELFFSLERQTNKSFEWIVVDDGSTDDTWKKLESYKQLENSFKIRIIHQENFGKHVAVNRAISMANGEYSFIVDSDDYLTDDAVEVIIQWLKAVSGRKDIAGVSGLRISKSTKKLLGQFPKNISEGNYIEAKNTERRKYSLLGDMAEIYRTEILRQHPFPVFDGERFITECVVWNQLAYEGYKVRWYNKIIYCGDYLADGLTKDLSKEINNFQGFTYATKQKIKCNSCLEGIIACGVYFEVAKQKGLTIREMGHVLETNMWRIHAGVFLRKLLSILKG